MDESEAVNSEESIGAAAPGSLAGKQRIAKATSVSFSLSSTPFLKV